MENGKVCLLTQSSYAPNFGDSSITGGTREQRDVRLIEHKPPPQYSTFTIEELDDEDRFLLACACEERAKFWRAQTPPNVALAERYEGLAGLLGTASGM